MLKETLGEIPEITKMSSKGQIVIPKDIREKMKVKTGSVFAMTTYDSDMIVLKKLDSDMKPEDLRTLELLEEAWEDIEKCRYKSATPEEFFKEMDKWKK